MNYGLKRGKRDRRDFSLYKYHQKLGGALPPLPPSLNRPRPIPQDQGETNLCTGYTACGLRKAKFGREFSPDWFCMKERLLDRDKVWGGSTLRTQARVLRTFGALPYELAQTKWQDKGEQYSTDPNNWNTNIDVNALPYKSQSAMRADFPYDTFDNIRYALAFYDKDNEGISVGIEWFYGDWNNVQGGILPMPKFPYYSGHNIGVSDWTEINGTTYLVADPHKGVNYGDNGLVYISREIANQYIFTEDGPNVFIDEDPEGIKKEQWGVLEICKDWLLKLLDYLKGGKEPAPLVIPDQTIPPETKPEVKSELKSEQPKYMWDTKENARHSVRVICDEMGLSLDEKNLICAVIECESGFDINAKNTTKNKDKSGDYGICQMNTNWYIGEGRPIASIDEALTNPEKCVRVLIKRFKEGGLGDWVCYKQGLYKKYLKADK